MKNKQEFKELIVLLKDLDLDLDKAIENLFKDVTEDFFKKEGIESIPTLLAKMDAAAKNDLKEFITGKQTLLNKLKNFDETKKKELQNFKELMRLL